MLFPLGVKILSLLGFNSETARRFAIVPILILGAIVALGLFQTWDYFDDKAAVRKAEAARERAASAAREKSADERVADAIADAKSEGDLHNAIDRAPGGVLSPAALALSCERLRKLGRVPAVCRSASGNGAQTPSQ